MLSGSLLYPVGAFLVTVVFNVPMNKALENVESESVEASNLWARYLNNLTAWNHVRTVVAFLGSLSFILALS